MPLDVHIVAYAMEQGEHMPKHDLLLRTQHKSSRVGYQLVAGPFTELVAPGSICAQA